MQPRFATLGAGLVILACGITERRVDELALGGTAAAGQVSSSSGRGFGATGAGSGTNMGVGGQAVSAGGSGAEGTGAVGAGISEPESCPAVAELACAMQLAGICQAPCSEDDAAACVSECLVEACTDIEANAACEVRVSGGCAAMCVPSNLVLVCARALRASCAGACTAQADAACIGSCDVAACKLECQASGAAFNCSSQCRGRAEGDCAGACEGNDPEMRTRCMGSCTTSFYAECDASCARVGPVADCEALCAASCEGSCAAQARGECQIDCQSEGFNACQGELQPECEARCQQRGGALFCDGQYLPHAGSLDACIASLEH